MKKIFGMGLILVLFSTVGWAQQPELYKVVPISPNMNLMATHISWLETVQPLQVFITDILGLIRYDAIDYAAGQLWYMNFVFYNSSPTAKTFKAEYSIYYSDGAGYVNKRYALTAPANSISSYKVNVTAYIAKLGLITLVGRVYGTGMGNFSDVKSQVLVY